MNDKVNIEQIDVKNLRQHIQQLVDELKSYCGGSRERSLVITKLEEGKMWLDKELGNIGGEDLNAKRDEIERINNL